jgi:hypothetical protein
LSKFISPTSPKRFEKSELWSEALGRSARRAISDLAKAGLLECPNLQGLIEGAFTVADLKKVLDQAGLSTSGRKADLVARLIENDDATAENMVSDLDLLVCSSEGSEIAQEYLVKVDQVRERAETSVLDALEHSRFEEASKIVAKFEANQVFLQRNRCRLGELRFQPRHCDSNLYIL